MSKIKEALTRKLGPLPAWAWLGILAGGVLVWRHFHPAPAQTGDSTTVPDVGALSDTTSPTLSGAGPGTGGGQGDGSGGSGGSSDPGTAPLPPAPADPGAGAYTTFPDYPYTPPTDIAGPGPAPTPRTSANPAVTTASLANGAVLTYNPATGVVTEKAPGKTAYRVASGVSDFAAYVAGVRKRSSATSASPRKPAPKTSPTRTTRSSSANKPPATSGRSQTTHRTTAAPKRSTAPHKTAPRPQAKTTKTAPYRGRH